MTPSSRKKCARSLVVQSLIFPKADFALYEALEWIVGHKFVLSKIEENTCSYRARQWPVEAFVKGSFRTIRFGKSSIQAVVGCPRPATSEAAVRRRKRMKRAAGSRLPAPGSRQGKSGTKKGARR